MMTDTAIEHRLGHVVLQMTDNLGNVETCTFAKFFTVNGEALSEQETSAVEDVARGRLASYRLAGFVGSFWDIQRWEPLDEMCDEYKRWNAEQGLNLGSADEHLFDENLTPAQREWLADFSRRWEAAERYMGG